MRTTQRQLALCVEHHGMALRGSAYLPAAEGRHPSVLLLHGFTGQRIEAGFIFVRLARALAQRGIAAVTFDFMHSGESDGSFENMLVTGELADALHMLQWTQSQPFADRSRSGVLGFSLGGLVAACVAGRAPQCKAVALIAPTTVTNLCRHATKSSPHGEKGRVVIGPHTLHAGFFEDARTLDPVMDATKHRRPTLLVQGTGDQAVPPAVSKEYVDAMRAADVPLTYHAIDGADHVFSSPTWRDQLITTTVEWLVKNL